MMGTLRTLILGASARAEEQVRDTFCLELIDQKIREAETSLKHAKYALAGLIQRERAESRQVASLERSIIDLTRRAQDALAAGREDLAGQAAQAIAAMENEVTQRRDTVARLETRTLQLRQSVEAAHRRIIDLKQGAVAARAAKREQDIQKRLGAHIAQDTAFEDAEALIKRVLGRDDPFEQSEILKDIETSLTHSNAADRLSEAGFGPPTKSTADDVMARLKAAQTT